MSSLEQEQMNPNTSFCIFTRIGYYPTVVRDLLVSVFPEEHIQFRAVVLHGRFILILITQELVSFRL
jgi:hypothetical protein